MPRITMNIFGECELDIEAIRIYNSIRVLR